MSGRVVAVHFSSSHTFSKFTSDRIELIAGVGVDGDTHAGPQVKHRSRVLADSSKPNLRQVHLIHGELLDEVGRAGHTVLPGDLGENITTRQIDLLGLSTGSVLRIGDTVVLGITGLRNPCGQINSFQPGLLDHMTYRDADIGTVRKAGVMAVVLHGGEVRPDDPIEIGTLPGPPLPLRPV